MSVMTSVKAKVNEILTGRSWQKKNDMKFYTCIPYGIKSKIVKLRLNWNSHACAKEFEWVIFVQKSFVILPPNTFSSHAKPYNFVITQR